MVCLSRPYPFRFFKDTLPQILFGPFLSQIVPFFFQFIIKGYVKIIISIGLHRCIQRPFKHPRWTVLQGSTKFCKVLQKPPT